MTEAAPPEKLPRRSIGSKKHHLTRFPTRTALAVSGVVALLYLLGPTIMWAYHLERGGYWLNKGILWPTPRLSDSLPQLHDAATLHIALEHLTAALYWRPQDAYTYRLLGDSYAALEDWPQAVGSFEQSNHLSPQNPIAAWEAMLVYEQMWRAMDDAPVTPLIEQFFHATLDGSYEPLIRLSCLSGSASSCYVRQENVAQPYAGFGEETAKTVPAVYVRSSVRIRYTLLMPADNSALRFLLGFDPASRSQVPASATYRIWVLSQDGTQTMVYTRTLMGQAAIQGWTPDWTDLSRWAGQHVTLIFETSSDVLSDRDSAWYAWGDPVLTAKGVAPYAAYAPSAHTQHAWLAYGLNSAVFNAQAVTAFERQEYVAAFARFDRAIRGNPPASFVLSFERAVAGLLSGNLETPQLLADVHRRDSGFVVYSVGPGTSTKIDGANFRWILPLNTNTSTMLSSPHGDGAGIMWGTGTALAIVSVQQTGLYTLNVQLQHGAPAPVQMAVGLDQQQIQPINLLRGDNSWETLSIPIRLTAGFHTIDVAYLNDAVINGHDRNAVVHWVEIQSRAP